MASGPQGYVDADGLTTKDVRIIVSAFKAMDAEKVGGGAGALNTIGWPSKVGGGSWQSSLGPAGGGYDRLSCSCGQSRGRWIL